MSELDARDPFILRGYEPLVRTTAVLIVTELRWRGIATPDDDIEDIMQLLRVKVWRAVRAFNPERVKRRRGETREEQRDRYVFMCLSDRRKDIAKKKRVVVLMIEDQTSRVTAEHDNGPRDAFDARYLAQTHDETFDQVEDAPPLVPNTLTATERGVLLLLYRDYTHTEIADRLGISRSDVSSAVRTLRSKLADWRPGSDPVPATTIAV